MSARDKGPTAFPVNAANLGEAGAYAPEPGMLLRDYFAAMAMQGLIAQSMGTAVGSRVEYSAQYAYAMADAMLLERAK